MLTSLVPSGAQQGEKGPTRFQAGSQQQQHYHSPPDHPPVLNSTSNFSTVSWAACQQMNEADKEKASYDEAAALSEILQEWNADEAIDFAGMERGTCADHPQLWDRSSLLVSPGNHCTTSLGSSEGVGALGITFMPSFQSNIIASRDNQQAGLEGSYTNLQGKRRMALPYIPDPGRQTNC